MIEDARQRLEILLPRVRKYDPDAAERIEAAFEQFYDDEVTINELLQDCMEVIKSA